METFLIFMVGVVVGWVARSIQFVKDRDCFNPDHKQE